MGVKFGSARSSYGNTTRGDQHNGLEVSTQSGYVHSLGWRVFRAKAVEQRTMIAKAMENACANNKIGYSQGDRLSLINWLGQQSPKSYDPATVTVALNCDCSSLVRVCCYYAGIYPDNFITSNEASKLTATGAFEEVTFKGLEYLCRGDILVTKQKGHTVVCLTNGSKFKETTVTYTFGGRTLKNGCEGEDVKELQRQLIALGFSCGDFGIDGDFGDCTEMAVTEFQRSVGISATGIADEKTYEWLDKMANAEDSNVLTSVVIRNGNCYVRKQPNVDGEKLGVAYKGTSYVYGGDVSEDGWISIVFKNQAGWVSGRYAARN